MLEDLKPILNDLGEKLDQMRISLEIPAKEEKIAELEYKMGEPSFWDDAAAAQKLNQELAALKGGVDTYRDLMAKYEDAETLYEMGIEENDASMEADIRAELTLISEGLETLQLEVLLSGEYDANDAILTLHAGAGGTGRRTGRRCSSGCTAAGRSGTASRSIPLTCSRAMRRA